MKAGGFLHKLGDHVWQLRRWGAVILPAVAIAMSSVSETALQNDLFEEKVNLYTGKAQFLATDIDLPGNNSLPVRLTAVSNATPDEVIYAGCYEKDI